MSCGCKKHTETPVDQWGDFQKTPAEACAECAYKHMTAAFALAREIGYEEKNEPYIVGELQLAGWHLSIRHPNLAMQIREIRIHWEMGRYALAATRWEPLIGEIRDIMRANATAEETGEFDVFIPLKAGGTAALDQELRYALRSIEMNLKNYRKIWIAGTKAPSWLTGVEFIRINEPRRIKQMNIHDAIKTVFMQPGCAENLIFWADDNVAIQPVDAANFPIVSTGENLLKNDSSEAWWPRTLRLTGETLIARGMPTVNYEAHTPVAFNRTRYMQLDREFDYYSKADGLCYISMYLNRYRVTPTHTQQEIKATFRGNQESTAGKTFIGYTDAAVKTGILEMFAELFPAPSKYETVCDHKVDYSSSPSIGVVLGTYGSPDLIELQLHYLCRVNNLPVLVHDDHSPEEEAVAEVCRRFREEGHDVEFVSTAENAGHRRGDLLAFAAGLDWAKLRGFELLYKVSRRWVICGEWASDARELAKETAGLTFSSFTEIERLGFRTEYFGVNVGAWADRTDQIRSIAAQPVRRLVEAVVHDIAKDIAGNAHPDTMAAMLSQHMAVDRQGYIQIPWMGTERKDPPPGILWHHKHTPEVYSAELEKVRSKK